MLKTNLICPYCNAQTYSPVCCDRCGARLLKMVNHLGGSTPYCDHFSAVFYYDGIIKGAITEFKFQKQKKFAVSFAKLMARCDPAPVDVIVPVPSFPVKDYDSAKILATALSEELQIPCDDRCVKKIKETPCQHWLPMEKRLHNLTDCFEASASHASNRSILICDDIITSGATIDEVAKACKRAGAKQVYALALAVSCGSFVN